jgi:two-component system chemotaxis response regulator CheB
MPSSEKRDIIVIGASLGGIDAIKQMLAGLPSDLPAALFVVLHQADTPYSRLASILGASTTLRVEEVLDGDRIEHGRVYVAPAGNHLLLRDGYVAVVRGPRENGHRPAVNPLFRTAAEVYGSRVIAVVLTGALDCGTMGALVVKARGGVTVAEDPLTATCGDMPASAIRSGAIDHIVELRGIAPLLTELNAQGAAAAQVPPQPEHVSRYSFVTCPHCHGSLAEITRGGQAEFECHVGHKFSLRSLYAEQVDHVEGALWAAIRALEESTSLAHRLSLNASGDLRSRFEDRERTMRKHADQLRDMVLDRSQGQRQDVADELSGS